MLNHLQEVAGRPIVNDDNLFDLYSFHPGGAYVAMVDSSVHFIKDSITVQAMFALISRDGEELVSHDSWQ
jgi:hypothetical protein